MNRVRVVFQDIDGVLNNFAFLYSGEVHHPDAKIAESNVATLNTLLERASTPEIPTMLVITSTWRHGKSRVGMQDIFREKGFKGTILDMTPFISKPRAVEIQQWLNETHYEVVSYVILDDDNELGHLNDKLVLVDPKPGLTPENVERALEVLAAV